MSLVQLPVRIEYPRVPIGPTAAAPTIATTSLDNNADRIAIICHPPKSGNIRKVIWCTRLVTTGGTFDVRVETVDATTGFPSETLFGTNTNGSQVVANGDDNAMFATTLTADAAVDEDDFIALVVRGLTGSTFEVPSTNWYNEVFPYGAQNTSGSYIKLSTNLPLFAVEYDDGTVYRIPGALAPVINGTLASGFRSDNFNTGTVAFDVLGARFQVPVTMRAVGAWVWVGFAASATGNVRLVSTAYNQGAGTGILGTVPIDIDIRRAATGVHTVMFDAPVTLSAGQYYRLVVEPDTTNNLACFEAEVSALTYLDAWFGQLWHATRAKDPTGDGSWTNYNSGTFFTPLMGLVVDQIDTVGVSANGQFAVASIG